MLDLSVKKNEEMYQKIIDWALKYNNCSWGAIINTKKGLIVQCNQNRPCWGELRRYADGSRPADSHPGDIPKVIEKGLREAIAVNIMPLLSNKEIHNEIIRELFNPSVSPWKKAVQTGWTLHEKNGWVKAASTCSTDFDATTLLNLLLVIKAIAYSGGISTTYTEGRKEGLSVIEAFALSLFFVFLDGKVSSHGIGYALANSTSIRRMLEQKAGNLATSLGTWRNQDDYNRPLINTLFMVDPSAMHPWNRFKAFKGFDTSGAYFFPMYDGFYKEAIEFFKQETFA